MGRQLFPLVDSFESGWDRCEDAEGLLWPKRVLFRIDARYADTFESSVGRSRAFRVSWAWVLKAIDGVLGFEREVGA